jgi:DNA invertase Pin-like site-specific DNA recombinase
MAPKRKALLATGKGRGSNLPVKPAKDVDKIMEMHERGVSNKTIASMYGVTPEAIRQRVNREMAKRNGNAPKGRRRMSAEEHAFIRTHYEEGYSFIAIAEALGRSESSIRYYVKREGIESSHPRRLDPDSRIGTPRIIRQRRINNVDDEKIAEIISAGRRSNTLAEVARLANVSEHTAERVLEVHVPTLLRYQIKGGMMPPGGILKNVAGDWISHGEALVDNGLRDAYDYDNLVTDYGIDQVNKWITKLEASSKAIFKVRTRLRSAVNRATPPKT